MMNYGFSIPANPCEYRIVGLKPPPGSPLEEAKARQQAASSHLGEKVEDKYYVFNLLYPLLDRETPIELSIFSPELFSAVSVLAANDRELQTLQICPISFQIPPQPFGNSRNPLAALSQTLLELITHAVKLKSSGGNLKEPQNPRQLHAKTFRESHIILSQTAIAVAHWSLTRAREHITAETQNEKEARLNAYLMQIPPGIFSEEKADQLRSQISSRRSLVENDGELFQFSELFGTLPGEMQEPSSRILHTILRRAGHLYSASNADEPPTTLSFSVFLCFLIAAHRQASRPSSSPIKYPLPPRLTKWASFLLDTYVTPLESSSWELPDEEDEAFLSDFDIVVNALHILKPDFFSSVADLVGGPPNNTGNEGQDWWLSPNWLRWAWLIVDSETVNVPNDPFECLLKEGLGSNGLVALSTTSYLYIPQDRSEC
jgi:hypothetical protein